VLANTSPQKTFPHYISGILTALTQPSPEALREAIRETRKLTAKPFGVNITLLPTINPPDYEGYARAAVEEGIRIIETAGNNRKQSHARSFQELTRHGR
jgi:NAD(P)H-dependent flavin oxidoreductase YrpB (nitropropane dioxygenase family)